VTPNPPGDWPQALSPWLRGLAWTAVALTLALITVGGLVTNTDSGLACPDWPTCFGTPFPKLVGGVLMEHGHRYLATALGFLTVLLVIGTHLREPRTMIPSLLLASPLILGGAVWAGYAKHMSGQIPAAAGLLVLTGFLTGIFSIVKAEGAARHAEAALLLVITQGLLGGLTVMYQLPVTVLIAHLATSMLFLGVLIWLAVRLDPPALETGFHDDRAGLLLGLTTVAIYLQVVLGASVRHTGAGLVCTGWLCKGALWPSNVHPAVHLHMAHRAFAIVVGVFASYVGLRLRKTALHANDRRGALLGAALPMLVITQISLGIATVWTLKEIWAVTAHLFVAALLLSCSALLWARQATRLPKHLLAPLSEPGVYA
jgi:heme A synthase